MNRKTIAPNTQRLLDLMSRYKLTVDDVGKMTSRSKSTVNVWRMRQSPRPIPQHVLSIVELCAPAYARARHGGTDIQDLMDATSDMVRSALRWSENAEPDLQAPAQDGGTVSGWLFNLDELRIYRAWSTQSSNGSTEDDLDHLVFAGPVDLFSTKRLAGRALRNAFELRAARALMLIDMINAADEKEDVVG